MSKVLLQSMIRSQKGEQLDEANIANSGNSEFTITLTDTDDFIKVNSFDVIYDKFLFSLKQKLNRSKSVEDWFNRQFKKWIMNGLANYPEYNDYPSKARLDLKLFPDLEEFIEDVMSDDPDIVEDDIRKHLPDFIKKNPTDATIFANGKKFGFKYIGAKWIRMMEELIDYLVAVAEHKGDTNIIPPQLHIKDIGRLNVPDAIRNGYQWHVYTIRNAEKIGEAEAKALINDLKEGTDYKIIRKMSSGRMMVQALNSKYTNAEGKIMKHCIASYGAEVDSGKIKIYSFWDKGKSPQATIEISRDGKIQQIKGRHNGKVKEELREDIVEFIVDEGWEWGSTVDQGKVDWNNLSKKLEKYRASLKAKESDKEIGNDEVEESFVREVEQQTKTKTKGSFKDFLDVTPSDLPAVSQSSSEVSSKEDDMELNVRDKDQTSAKLAGVTMDITSLGYLLAMDLDSVDDMSDKEAEELASIDITKPDINTLPSVISKAVMAVGDVEPEFNQVKNLPGYLKSGIRAIGREVFKPFTSTKIENIQVLANLNGSGPNDQSELNAVAGFLEKYGTFNSNVIDMSFTDKIPGYEAQVKVYTYANYTFMAVKDHAGDYMYSWPSTDTKKSLADNSVKHLK